MTVGTIQRCIISGVAIVDFDPIHRACWISTSNAKSTIEANLNSAAFVRKLYEVLALKIGQVGLRPVG